MISKGGGGGREQIYGEFSDAVILAAIINASRDVQEEVSGREGGVRKRGGVKGGNSQV